MKEQNWISPSASSLPALERQAKQAEEELEDDDEIYCIDSESGNADWLKGREQEDNKKEE